MANYESAPPSYTTEQLGQYLEHVGLPSSPVFQPSQAGSDDCLIFLQKLIRAQLQKIPFENLDLTVLEPAREIVLGAGNLFEKFVGDGRGRGGYCMENNIFFATILRTLGFQVTSVGARVSHAVTRIRLNREASKGFRGWGHMANIVTIAGKRFLVDVGFANHSTTLAIPLEDNYSCQKTGDESGGSFARLTKEDLGVDEVKRPEQMLWVYSVRFNTHMDWIPCYCFSELESSFHDYEVMSFYASQNPKSWFRLHTVCTVALLSDDGDRVIGDLTLFQNELKERRFGRSRLICKIKTADELSAVLNQYFKIKL